MIFNKKKPTLVSIGDIAIDAFVRIKEASEVCSLNSNTCQLCLSFASKIPYEFDETVPAVGNSANASVAGAKLGFTSSLITHIGKDRNGKDCISALKKAGVNTSHIYSHKESRTNYHYVLWYGPPGAASSPRATEQACGQIEQGPDKGKSRGHTDAEEPEGQGQKPDERREDAGQQRQRPAHGQQQTPEEKYTEDFHGVDGMITPAGRWSYRFCGINGGDVLWPAGFGGHTARIG